MLSGSTPCAGLRGSTLHCDARGLQGADRRVGCLDQDDLVGIDVDQKDRRPRDGFRPRSSPPTRAPEKPSTAARPERRRGARFSAIMVPWKKPTSAS
jgi:hypothetical protein